MIRSLLLLSAVLLSCRQLPDSEAEPLRANIRAREIWKMHEAAVARAANYQPRDGDEFGHACAFFKEVTGIDVHGEGEFFGWMPTKDTLADLTVLRTWYLKNADRLRADESGHVAVIVESKRGSPRKTMAASSSRLEGDRARKSGPPRGCGSGENAKAADALRFAGLRNNSMESRRSHLELAGSRG